MAGKFFLDCGDTRNRPEFLDAQMRKSEAIGSSLFRLMGSTSCRSNGGTNFRRANAGEIGGTMRGI
jgi:hypothetical protein